MHCDRCPLVLPEEIKLQVHREVVATLAKLNPNESRRVVRQLVEAATEKALKPWRRQQEIKNVIDDALPFSIKYSDEKPKALRAAAEAISKLRPQATREELQLGGQEGDSAFHCQTRARKAVRADHPKRAIPLTG